MIAGSLREECFLLIPVLLLLIVFQSRPSFRPPASFAAGSLFGIGLYSLYNRLIFHSFLGLHAGVMISEAKSHTNLSSSILARLQSDRILLLGKDSGWKLLAFGLLCTGIMALVRQHQVKAIAMVGLASISVLYYWIFIPGSIPLGFFSSMPVIALAALPQHLEKPEHRRQAFFIKASALGFILLTLMTTPNYGGTQWGPRYLLPTVPLLTIAGINGYLALERSMKGGLRIAIRIAVAALLIVSLSTTLEGLGLLRINAQKTAELQNSVLKQKAQVVVTDIWFVPQLLGPIFLDQKILFSHTESGFQILLNRLKNLGIQKTTLLTTQAWGPAITNDPDSCLHCGSVQDFPWHIQLFNCQPMVKQGSAIGYFDDDSDATNRILSDGFESVNTEAWAFTKN